MLLLRRTLMAVVHGRIARILAEKTSVAPPAAGERGRAVEHQGTLELVRPLRQDDRAVAVEEGLEVVARPRLGPRRIGHRPEAGQVARCLAGEMAVPGAAVVRDKADRERLVRGVAIRREVEVGRLLRSPRNRTSSEPGRPSGCVRDLVAGATRTRSRAPCRVSSIATTGPGKPSRTTCMSPGRDGSGAVLAQPLGRHRQLLDLRQRRLGHPELRVAPTGRGHDAVREAAFVLVSSR